MAYSPQLFIEFGPSVVQRLSNTANNVRDFCSSMSGVAQRLNSVIASANSEVSGHNDSLTRTKRELRSCRENFMKTLASSVTFVDRFNKLLCYADIDETWKSKMIESAGKGDYKTFSSYITQLKRFLDQVDQTYQDFVQACSDAEAQCEGIPRRSVSSQASGQAPPMVFGVTITPARLLLGFIAGIVGIGTGMVVYSIMGSTHRLNVDPKEFKTTTSPVLRSEGTGAGLPIFAGLAAAAVVVLIAYYGFKSSFTGDGKHSNRSTSLAIEYHGYDPIRSTASKINSSAMELRKVLSSLSTEGESRLKVQEQVNVYSFDTALTTLLTEVRKGYEVVNPCYEELDRGITVSRVNNF